VKTALKNVISRCGGGGPHNLRKQEAKKEEAKRQNSRRSQKRFQKGNFLQGTLFREPYEAGKGESNKTGTLA